MEIQSEILSLPEELYKISNRLYYCRFLNLSKLIAILYFITPNFVIVNITTNILIVGLITFEIKTQFVTNRKIVMYYMIRSCEELNLNTNDLNYYLSLSFSTENLILLSCAFIRWGVKIRYDFVLGIIAQNISQFIGLLFFSGFIDLRTNSNTIKEKFMWAFIMFYIGRAIFSMVVVFRIGDDF